MPLLIQPPSPNKQPTSSGRLLINPQGKIQPPSQTVPTRAREGYTTIGGKDYPTASLVTMKPQPKPTNIFESAKSTFQNLQKVASDFSKSGGVAGAVGRKLQKTPDTSIKLDKINYPYFDPGEEEQVKKVVQFISGLPGAIAQSYGRSLTLLSTEDGKKQLKEGAKNLPSTLNQVKTHIDKKEWGEAFETALSNPALSVALDVSDFIPIAGLATFGAKKTLTSSRQLLKKVVKEGIEEAGEKGVKTVVKEVPKREILKVDTQKYSGVKTASAVIDQKGEGSMFVEFKLEGQGKGQGTALVSQIEQQFIDKGVTKANISAFKEAQGFWEKQGYKVVPGTEVKNGLIKMEKQLEPKISPKNINMEDLKQYGKNIVAASQSHYGLPTTKLGRELVDKASKEVDQISVLGLSSKDIKIRRDARAFQEILSDRTPDNIKVKELLNLKKRLESANTPEGQLIQKTIDRIVEVEVPKKPTKISNEQRKQIQGNISKALSLADTPQKITKAVDTMISVGGKDSSRLRVIRASLAKEMKDMSGASSGYYKTDFAHVEKMKKDVQLGPYLDELQKGINKIDDQLAELPKTEKTPKPESLPFYQTKVSKLGLRVEQTAIEKKLVNELGDLPSYQGMNMKEQAKMAADLLNSDPDKALRIALGQETPPKGLKAESVFKALENSITDSEMARKLANSPLVSEASEIGQRIKALDVKTSDSPVEAIRQVIDARKEAIEKKLGKTVVEATTDTIKDIKKEIKKVTANKSTWSEFIKEIQC